MRHYFQFSVIFGYKYSNLHEVSIEWNILHSNVRRGNIMEHIYVPLGMGLGSIGKPCEPSFHHSTDTCQHPAKNSCSFVNALLHDTSHIGLQERTATVLPGVVGDELKGGPNALQRNLSNGRIDRDL